jgi:MFS family permease
VLGERYGLGVPFVVLGVVCGLTGLALAFAPGEAGRVPEPGPPLREMLRAAFADDLLIASVLLTLIVALMWMTVELLVPLHLDELGYSASKIGLVFSVSAILFAGSSWVTARRAERHATVRFAAAWSTVFGLGLVFAAIATSASATIVFLCVMGVTTGAMIAITYPLGAVGAKTGGFSVAVVGALLNMVWAGSGILGPGAGGALAGSVGDTIVFVGLAVIGLASAWWMWARARRTVAASSG